MTEPGWPPYPSGPPSEPPRPSSGVLPPADVTGRRASRIPLILAILGALVVVIAIATLLDDDGDGTGTFGGEATDEADGRHEVSVDGGSVLVLEVEPATEDLDAVVELDLDREDRRRIVDVYEDTAVGQDLLRRDVGLFGDRERMFLAVPFDVDVTVEVSGFDGSEGEYEIELDVIELDADLDEDADGEELLEAVVATEEVPGQLRADAELLLGEA